MASIEVICSRAGEKRALPRLDSAFSTGSLTGSSSLIAFSISVLTHAVLSLVPLVLAAALVKGSTASSCQLSVLPPTFPTLSSPNVLSESKPGVAVVLHRPGLSAASSCLPSPGRIGRRLARAISSGEIEGGGE
jgi:hypothetical protein